MLYDKYVKANVYIKKTHFELKNRIRVSDFFGLHLYEFKTKK